MARRIQRSAPIPNRPMRPTARTSGSVPGRREVVVDAPTDPNRYPRSAEHAGRAVAKVYGGGVSEAPGWSGPNGAGKDLGRISVNSPKSTTK
jgi:hypothetical protein